MVRAALLVPGGTSTFADWCFRMDGRAVAVALSAPSRLWMWQRDVVTGTLNGPPRLIYTLSTGSNFFAPAYTRVNWLSSGKLLAFQRSGGKTDVFQVSDTFAGADTVTGAGEVQPLPAPSSDEEDDPLQPSGSLVFTLSTRDERCLYATGNTATGLGYWQVLNVTSGERGAWTDVAAPAIELPWGFTIDFVMLSTTLDESDPEQQKLLWAVSAFNVAVFRRNDTTSPTNPCALQLLAYSDYSASPIQYNPLYVFGGTLLNNVTLLTGAQQSGVSNPFAFRLIRLAPRNDTEMQQALAAAQAAAADQGETLPAGYAPLPYQLVEQGYIPMPPGPKFFAAPTLAMTPDKQHVLVTGGGAELFSVRLDTLLSTLGEDAFRDWPVGVTEVGGDNELLPPGIKQVQAGFSGDQIMAVTSKDGRFLYTTGDVSDIYAFKLDPVTGRRIDGGRRYFSPQSQATHRDNYWYTESMTVLTSLTLSADAEQRFVYAAGSELHSFVRNTTTGALYNRTIFPALAFSSSGQWGRPVAMDTPMPHVLIPDGKYVRRFRTHPETGELLLPSGGSDIMSDPTDGVAFAMVSASLGSVITAMAVDRHAVFLGAIQRSVVVVPRSAVTGLLSSSSAQTMTLVGSASSTAVVAILLDDDTNFLYSFDTAGGLVVYARAPSGVMLTYLQTSAPPVDGAVFTAAATIWSNSAQSLIVAVLQSSDVVLYRRNVVTGLVDSPSRLVRPGASGDATIFSGQGPALSVAVAGGTVFVTTLGALQLPSAVLLELETNNFVVPTPGGAPVANATEDELWAARWGIDWEPAFRLQLRMEGSKMDGTYISYRPDLSSATYYASTLSSCDGKVEVPVAFEQQIPSSSADACLVGSSPVQGSSILCASSLVMEGGFCSTYQKFQNMEVANGGVKILAAQDTSLSAIDAADPGRTDRFDLPPPLDTSSPDASHFWGDANNENHLLALHVNAQDAAVLREFMLGCDGGPLSSCSEAGAYLALAPFPSSDTVPLTNHSDESDALWRMVSATRWLNERIGLRQFLPENERGSILPFPTTNIPVVDEAIGINVVKPNPCNSWLPGVWCEGSHIVSISWVGWAGSLSDGTVPDLFAGLPYLQSFRLVDSPIRGVLPSSFCNLRRLRYFHIERSGLSGLPDCFGPEHMPTLRHFHVSEANVQQMPPSLARAEKLTWLNFAHNKPADGAAVDSAASSIIDVPDLSTLRSLVVLNISSSSLRAPLSNFRCTSWSSLHIYALDGNRLTGSLPSHWFNGNSQLRQVSLSDNSGISGTFPSLFTATSLLSLSLSGCGLSGSLPASWSQLTLLQSLDVSGNKLTLPISSLSGCTSLLYADLSSNGVDCPADGLLDSLLSHLPVSLQTLRLDHNPLRGCRWQSAVGSLRSSSPLLQALTASHTGITQLPEDLFEPSLPWRALDFSYCQLTVGVSDRYVPSSQLLSFSIKGNPALDGFAVLGRTKPRSATQCGAAASTRVGEEASVLRALR